MSPTASWLEYCVIRLPERQIAIATLKENRMKDETLPWDDAALLRLDKMPSFVRSMAKGKIEKAAKEAGESRVTVAFLDASKGKLMG